MEGLTELIPLLVQEGDYQLWNNFLQSCKELKVFVKNPIESVSIINSLLNETESRIHGLRILEAFLNQSSRNIINEHIVYWFHQCLKGVAQPLASFQCPRSFEVLSVLLDFSTEFPDVKKQTSQVFIPKILDSIVNKLKESPQNSSVILKCLYTCLRNYGKSCGNFKGNLETIFVKLLVSSGYPVHLVAKCFHLLAQCGAPGNDAVNYINNWRSQHLVIINSLHLILDQLFSDVNEILCPNSNEIEKRTLDLPLITDESPLIKAHKLRLRFSNLCQVLETMLLSSFPTCKKIYPESVLGVVCRSLEVTCKSLESKISNSTYALMIQLPEIHVSSIKVLSSLILSCRSNMLPFSTLISKLFIQIFKWTSVENWPQNKKRPFSSLKQAVYKCLLHWLSVGKSCSFVDPQVNIIIESIVKDIKGCKKTVTLNLGKKSARKAGRNSNSLVESTEKLEMSEKLCYSALSCIPPILRTPLSSSMVKNLQEAVVQLIFEIQRASGWAQHFPPPYTSSRCRALLYSTLLSLCMSPHPQFPPPLHYANSLFSSANSDDSAEVIKTCTFALSCIAPMLRPCAPSFEFHFDLNSEVVPINPIPDSPVVNVNPSLKRNFANVISEKHAKNVTVKSVKKRKTRSRKAKEKVNHLEEIPMVCSDIAIPDTLPNDELSFSGYNVCDSNDELSSSCNNACDSNDDLINLDDLSDDSLVMVDSDKKTDVSKNCVNSEDSCGEVITLSEVKSPSSLVTGSNEDKEADMKIEILNNEKSKNSLKKHSNNLTDLDKIAEISITDEFEASSSGRSTRSGKHRDKCTLGNLNLSKIPGNASSSNLSEISFDDVSICESSQEYVEMETRSSKKLKDSNCTGNAVRKANLSPICEDVSIIDLDVGEPTKRITRSSKTPPNDEVTDINSQDSCDTTVSEDVSIIESFTSPQRRSKRNCNSSQNNKSNGMNSKDIILIINDENDPPSKQLRSSYRSSTSHDLKGSVESIREASVSNSEVDEMMNSFIDSVPEY